MNNGDALHRKFRKTQSDADHEKYRQQRNGTLKQSPIRLKNFAWSEPFRNKNKTYTTFRFQPVTINETFKHLKQLKQTKSAGVDNLPPGFHKDAAIFIAEPLTR